MAHVALLADWIQIHSKQLTTDYCNIPHEAGHEETKNKGRVNPVGELHCLFKQGRNVQVIWNTPDWMVPVFLCLPCVNPQWTRLPGRWGRWWLMHCKIKRHISRGPKHRHKDQTWTRIMAYGRVHLLKCVEHIPLLTAPWPLFQQSGGCAEFHLSPKVLFGVHIGCGGKGVIEEDDSVALHVKGQVGTRGEDVILPIRRFGRAIVSHMEKTQPWDIQGKKAECMKTWQKNCCKKGTLCRDTCEIYGHWADFSYRIHRSGSLGEF